ncbi:MAG: glycosyltransferase family 2 protein [Jaaginema sp. PMC 1079.18]|nr:glycosyltransferase family 2 protein [Jaaginema sp. PMC 1080.18]MEC4852362.1 glycosyltransferase family 2 protein [Jaaginema sp. PMC 1079.18]MEC4866387.1 glycosyltransferase family 2 protein [Jaaginema sp. PMC 1078.18]
MSIPAISNIILWILAIALLLPIAVLVIECTMALLPGDRDPKTATLPQFNVLMPAHDEAAVIDQTLDFLLPQLASPDQLIVIADNCSDNTAEIARNRGATVLERENTTQRGKGYALDYGLSHLETNPPEIVVLVDADCRCLPGSIAKIASQAAAQNRPVQALYLMEQPPNPQPKDSVSALAFLVKNLVRPRGLSQLGLPCLLTGTGMAFPWEIIRQAPLASGNIVEDMQLGLDLAIAGYPPQFCQTAKVTGILPPQGEAAKSQRTRWEHGHLQTLLTQVPRLTIAAIQQLRFDLLALALDLVVPPLSLLVMAWGAGLIIAAVGAFLGASWLPFGVLAIAGIFIFFSIVSAWAKFGQEEIPGKSLLAVPFYVLWKIPLYFAFLVKRQSQWVRTERSTAPFDRKN